MSNDLLVEQDGGVLRVTLNRASDCGMTDPMAIAFARVVNEAHQHADIVVLRSNGRDFCTGRSRGDNPTPPPSGPLDAYKRRDEYDPIFNCYWAIRRSPIPVVGVIKGRAMGFGLAIASLCDVSFAADSATFNIPEMNHNIMPTMVMSAVFDRLNRNAILWLTYSCDYIDAQRAMTYGIVSTVVAEARLDAEVAAFEKKMLSTPRPAILGLKEYLRVAPTMDAQGGVDYARALHSMVNSSSEMKTRQRSQH